MRIRGAGGRAAVVLTLAAALTGAGVSAQADPQTAAQVLQTGVQNVQTQGVMPGVIGMVRDGEQTSYAQAGMNDLFQQIPADPRSKFRIGSNTKLFTSVVMLQLEAEGKLSLDDTVDKWLPGLVSANGNDGTKITIRALLNHSSRIHDYMENYPLQAEYLADSNPDKQYDPRQLVQTALAAADKPEDQNTYSNTNYIIAGMIIQKVTGDDVGTEIRNRIIDKLGLTNTTFPTMGSQLTGNWMHGYETVRDVSFSPPSLFQGAGAIVSTQDDLANFTRAVFSGQLLPQAQMQELETTVPIDKGNYGLGVFKVPSKCGDVYAHTGSVLGYESVWFTSPDGNRQAVMAANENSLPIRGDATMSQLENEATNAYCATAP